MQFSEYPFLQKFATQVCYLSHLFELMSHIRPTHIHTLIIFVYECVMCAHVKMENMHYNTMKEAHFCLRKVFAFVHVQKSTKLTFLVHKHYVHLYMVSKSRV